MTAPTPIELFAMRRGARLAHFYPSAAQVNMCGTGPVVRVRITPDEAGSHWAWWGCDMATMRMVYDDERACRMCSPDGFVAHERGGAGKVVRVRVDVLRGATDEEMR